MKTHCETCCPRAEHLALLGDLFVQSFSLLVLIEDDTLTATEPVGNLILKDIFHAFAAVFSNALASEPGVRVEKH
jgi:hypothetical protein